jgi:hypothetical protein
MLTVSYPRHFSAGGSLRYDLNNLRLPLTMLFLWIIFLLSDILLI